MPWGHPDPVRMRRRVVDEQALAVHQHPAIDAMNGEIPRRPAVALTVIHFARVPAGVADGQVVQVAIGANFADEADLAFGDRLGHAQAHFAQILLAARLQRLFQHPVDALQDRVLALHGLGLSDFDLVGM